MLHSVKLSYTLGIWRPFLFFKTRLIIKNLQEIHRSAALSYVLINIKSMKKEHTHSCWVLLIFFSLVMHGESRLVMVCFRVSEGWQRKNRTRGHSGGFGKRQKGMKERKWKDIKMYIQRMKTKAKQHRSKLYICQRSLWNEKKIRLRGHTTTNSRIWHSLSVTCSMLSKWKPLFQLINAVKLMWFFCKRWLIIPINLTAPERLQNNILW